MKKIYYLLILLIGNSIALADISKIHPYLQSKINVAGDNSLIPVYIIFNEHLSLNDFSDISYDTPKKERRKIVIERLMNFSENYQRNVIDYLNIQKSRGVELKYEVLWIANVVIVSANPETILELSDFQNIKMICYDPQYPIEELYDTKQMNAPFIGAVPNDASSPAPQPGLILIKADQVWALGNKGKGVLVANADDGFWWKHPDLVKGVWQNLGEDANNNGITVNIATGTGSTFDAGDINGVDDDGNGKIDDLIGWDFSTSNYNITTASHGSATMGQVIGDGTGGTATGVAPEAKCIPMRNSGGESFQWQAFQYGVLMGADVITSSLSYKWYFSPKPDYSMMRLITDMSLAAGVVHTNSTSNDGGSSSAPVPLNISTAGNCPAPWRHPDQVKVGNLSGVIGVGNVNASTDVIVSSSPSGPATWGNWYLWGAYTYPIDSNHKDYPYSRTAPVEMPDSMGLLKPDVSAPGAGTTSTYVSSGTGYAGFSGTSSATPHTAGTVALMLSINPEMLPGDIDRVIELTSVEKGNPGKDSRYGAGRIDALAATTSPKFTAEGINGGRNMLINNTVTANDTARELAGFKISTNVNPGIGSLKKVNFSVTTNATVSHILSFDLYWDKDGNNLVNTGDIKLKSLPFSNTNLLFDSLKFKFVNDERKLILSAKTSASASNQNVNFTINDTNSMTAYYVTTPFNTNFPLGTITGIIGNNAINDLTYSLSQNFPNPFNPSTLINYVIAKDGNVKLNVYDVTGRLAAVLVNSYKNRGSYSVEFDAGNNLLSSGVYYYTIESGDFIETKRMLLIK